LVAHRYQAYEYDGVGYPAHVPVDTVNAVLKRPVPDKEGATVFTGARFVVAELTDHTDKEPKPFDFDVATVTYLPASSATWEYVDDVARSIAKHWVGSVVATDATDVEQRYHWCVEPAAG